MSTPTPPSASAVTMGSGIGNAQKSVAQISDLGIID